jgi:hypothetical protein
MKIVAERKGLEEVRRIKELHARTIRSTYEEKAKDCITCETKGACCLDAHFVNVKVSRLEAILMVEELRGLEAEAFDRIKNRITNSIEIFGLSSESEETYACPLFDAELGCTVHKVKPVPCVQHACYEKEEDLPPDVLGQEVENEIDGLVRAVYGKPVPYSAIPVAMAQILAEE